MQELHARVKRLQSENDQLQSQVEKSLKLGKDVREGDRAEPPIVSIIKEKNMLFSAMVMPLQMMNCPPRGPHKESSSMKEGSRQHKEQIAKEGLTPPFPQ